MKKQCVALALVGLLLLAPIQSLAEPWLGTPYVWLVAFEKALEELGYGGAEITFLDTSTGEGGKVIEQYTLIYKKFSSTISFLSEPGECASEVRIHFPWNMTDEEDYTRRRFDYDMQVMIMACWIRSGNQSKKEFDAFWDEYQHTSWRIGAEGRYRVTQNCGYDIMMTYSDGHGLVFKISIP